MIEVRYGRRSVFTDTILDHLGWSAPTEDGI